MAPRSAEQLGGGLQAMAGVFLAPLYKRTGPCLPSFLSFPPVCFWKFCEALEFPFLHSPPPHIANGCKSV